MIEDFTEYHREYYHVRRRRALEYLGGKCVKCGSTENLEIDHVERSDKEFNISKNLTVSNPTVRAELDKCQLLCRKHHLAKTAKENGGFTHGTTYAWMRKKCRCDVCEPVWRAWNDSRNAARRRGAVRGPYDTSPVVCGTERSYRKGCRCGDCRKAHTDRAAEYRASKAV